MVDHTGNILGFRNRVNNNPKNNSTPPLAAGSLDAPSARCGPGSMRNRCIS
jgi:hypothetical protein